MSGKKLLVADDSLTIQKVIRLALSNEGYEIQAASDGSNTLQQIILFKPHVVLIDISLPGKSAFELKREVNQNPDLQEMRFILMSNAFEKIDETQTKEVQFHGQLTKPFDPAHLRQILSEVLAEKSETKTVPSSIDLVSPSTSSENRSALPPLTEVSPPEFSNEFFSKMDLSKDHFPPLPEIPELNQNSDLFTHWDTPTYSEGALDFLDTHEEKQTHPDTWEPPISPETSSSPSDPPPPPPAFTTSEGDIKELTETTLKISGMDDFQWSVKEPSIELPTPPPSPILSPENSPLEQTKISINSSQLETAIHEQVEAVLQKMAHKLLPEVAEKIIKQEIHRILSDS